MSGIALIIPSADFSANKLGTVTFQEDVAVTGISINLNASYSGQSFTPSVSYTPSTTNQKGVTWSITAGGTYATIDATTGLVTILSGASSSSITVKAVSNVDNTIMATATTSVTYVSTPIYPTALAISGDATVTGQSSQYSVAYTPSNTNQQGVTWSVSSGGTYASINSTTGLLTILSAANASQVVIRATSTTAPTVYVEKTLTLTYQVSQIGRKAIICNPVDDASATANSTTNPIDGVYYNLQKTLTSAYNSGTVKDTNNLDMCNFVKETDAIATALIAAYFTGNYTTIKTQGTGDSWFLNAFAALPSVNNSGYNKSFFANAQNTTAGSGSPYVFPRLWLNNLQNGTYKLKVWISASGISTTSIIFNTSIFVGMNAQKTSLPAAEPSNFIDSPIIVDNVVVTDNKAVIYWGYNTNSPQGKAWIYNIRCIEISRTA